MNTFQRLVAFYGLQVELLRKWRPGRRALIRRGIVTFVVSFLSLLAVVALLPSVTATNAGAIALAVIVLAVLNVLIRPVLLALLAPVSVILVVIATLIWQVGSFLLLGPLVPGFTIGNLGAAIVGSFVYAIVNTFLTALLSIDQDDDSYYGTLVRSLAGRRADVIRSDKPGVLIVQIDGLAHPILTHQIRAGRVPVISDWVRSRKMTLDRWIALLPSQTSASQAGILHGNNSFIPAFRWWEKPRGRMLVSNHPEDAIEIVQRASDGEGLLSNDGASVGNLVSGDAVRSYITMATIKDKSQGLGRSQTFFSFFASPYGYLHTLVLTVGEIVKEYVQANRAHRRHVEPSMHRGMPYPVARAATNVALRALSTSLVIEEMYRGTPVIYVDYTDYDEIAHHSGPERGETLDALDGVDLVLGALEKAAADAPRPYKLIVLSDHGQSLGATFLQRYGKTLQEVIAERMGGASVEAATQPADTWGPVNAALSEAAQAGHVTGAMTRAAFRGRTVDGVIQVGDSEESKPEEGGGAEKAPPELVVCASGNLALIYFPRLPGRVSLETIEATWPGLVSDLARHPGVGALMVRSDGHGTIVFGPEGAHYLADDRVDGDDPVAKYGEYALAGFQRVDGMEFCGDLVAISLLESETDEVAAFEELIGSHGGLGGAQTQPFILHPSEWPVDEPLIGAEAVYRQIRRWLEAAGIPLGKPAAAPPEPTPAAIATAPAEP